MPACCVTAQTSRCSAQKPWRASSVSASISPIEPKAREGVVMGVNYGLDKVRFPSPVKVDSKVRARQTLVSADQKDPNTLQLKYQVTIEVEGQPAGRPYVTGAIVRGLDLDGVAAGDDLHDDERDQDEQEGDDRGRPPVGQ